MMKKNDRKAKKAKPASVIPTSFDCCWYDPGCYDLCCGGVCCG
jgi:hypothetical protein